MSEVSQRKSFNAILANRFAKDGVFEIMQDPIKWTGRDGQEITVALGQVERASWVQYGRSCRLMCSIKDGNTQIFDGFRPQDLAGFKKFFQDQADDIELEEEEVSAAGNNWGRFPIEGSQLHFKTMDSKTAFKVNLSVIAQCAVPKPNEIEIQFHNPPNPNKDDHYLSEMRLYVPPVLEGEEEDISPALKFQKQILQSEEVKTSGGQSIVEIEEHLGKFVTPRGNYAIEMHANYLRMRGKTYDYKINYPDLEKFFLLPRPDGVHVAFVISLTKPIRQGQQRYHHLVMQLTKRDHTLHVNMDPAELEKQYDKRLTPEMQGSLPDLVAKTFKALTKKPVFIPHRFKSMDGQQGLKCALKANEGHLFPLEKQFVFIHKPPTIVAFNEVQSVEFERYEPTSSSARSFDLAVHLKPVAGEGPRELTFSGIDRNEYATLFNFLKQKKMRINNEQAPHTGSGRGSRDYGPDLYKQRLNDELGDDDDDDDESDDSDFGSDDGSDSSSGDDDLSGGDTSEDEDGNPKPKKKKKKVAAKKKQKPQKEGGADSPAKKRKKKQKKDPNAPKKNLTSYLYFSTEMRSKFKEQNPEMSTGELAKLTGTKWGELTDEQKAPYLEKAAKDKARYEEEMKNYTRPSDLDSSSSSDEDDKPKKKKQKKDPNAPKRGMSAYMFYSADMRVKLKEKQPDLENTQIMKEIGKMWKEMSGDAKKPYEEKAAADKLRYAEEMKTYVPPPGFEKASPAKRKAGGKDKKGKKKQKKDPNAPKRAMTAYMFYSADMRVEIKEKMPELKSTEIMSHIGKQWKEMADDAKKPYEEKAAADKLRYAEEMKTYVPPVQQEDLDSSDSDSSSSSSGSDSGSDSGSGSGSGSSSGSDSDSDSD